MKVWVKSKEVVAGENHNTTESRRKYKIELTMDIGSKELREQLLQRRLQVLNKEGSDTLAKAQPAVNSAKTYFQLQIKQTYDFSHQ